MIEPHAIEKYIDSLTKKVSSDHYQNKLVIDGGTIKNLTSVPQINSFVIRKLFDQWQNEAENLKSDYFDFDHEDVKSALKDFLAKLSFHISIKEDHFKPLFTSALKYAFEYLQNPIFFLQQIFFSNNEDVLMSKEVKKRLKYLKLYSSEVNSLINSELLNHSQIKKEELYKLIEESFEDSDYEKEEITFLESLEHLVPLTEIGLELVEEENVQTETESETPEKLIEHEEPLVIIEDKEESHPKDKKPLYEKFESKSSYEVKDKESETANFSPISSMLDGVSLHQKYFFIRELFGGDSLTYDNVMETLDTFSNYDDASNFLLNNYAQKLEWHSKEESVGEFFSILNRRF